jgi:hypothetical protein
MKQSRIGVRECWLAGMLAVTAPELSIGGGFAQFHVKDDFFWGRVSPTIRRLSNYQDSGGGDGVSASESQVG